MEVNLPACFIISLLWSVLAQTTTNPSLTFQDSGLDNVVFADDVAFVVSQQVRSLVDCAGRCLSVKTCVSFTQGPGWCRGHSVAPVAQTSAAQISGSKTHVAKERQFWLSRMCSDHEDCPVSHSECFKGTCLCSPGYYYSEGSHGCVETCTQSNLSSTTVLRYPNSRLLDYSSLGDFYGITLDTCLSHCLTHPMCRSLNYWEEGSVGTGTTECYIKGTVPDVISAQKWDPSHDFSDYYQRGCE